MIRKAVKDDVVDILSLGQEFYYQSDFQDIKDVEQGYDPEQFSCRIYQAINSKENHVLVSENNNVLDGFIIFDCVRHYTTYPVSHMFLFYAKTPYKLMNLLSKAVELAKHNGAKRFYASSSAGFQNTRNDRLLNLLYKKKGFNLMGQFYKKELL